MNFETLLAIIIAIPFSMICLRCTLKNCENPSYESWRIENE